MLRFAEVEGGDIKLTDMGKPSPNAAPTSARSCSALLALIPLAAHIRRVLDERANHVAPKSRFLDELEDHMSTEDAEQTLRAVTAGAATPRLSPTTTRPTCSAWKISSRP